MVFFILFIGVIFYFRIELIIGKRIVRNVFFFLVGYDLYIRCFLCKG